jgi:uncharacterized SAM-binding protein YcdF (DUF218 family)
LEVVAGYIIKAFMLPPGVNFFAVMFALIFLRKFRRLQRGVIGAAFITLWMWCTPLVAGWHARTVEHIPAFTSAIDNSQAIVILSGGRYAHAAEFGGTDTIRADTLERVRYGAILARKLELPIAVSGGAVTRSSDIPLGVLMAETITEEFGVPVRWIEKRSRNTAQNAIYLRELLPVQRIVLVTHAIHMPRSVAAFERVGFIVAPAPTRFTTGETINFNSIFDWLPAADALVTSRAALHELIGMLYYKLRH